MGDFSVTPDSRFEMVSLSAIEGASVSWRGEVNWHRCRSAGSSNHRMASSYHGVDDGTDEHDADRQAPVGCCHALLSLLLLGSKAAG